MESFIKNHIENILELIKNSNQSKYYEFLLKEGKVFREQNIIQPDFEPKIKQCYNNSLQGLLYHDLPYYEGYFLTEIGLPLEHAFNIENDKVIDFTSHRFGFEVREWFGIEIPDDIVKDWALSREQKFLTPLQFYFRFHQI